MIPYIFVTTFSSQALTCIQVPVTLQARVIHSSIQPIYSYPTFTVHLLVPVTDLHANNTLEPCHMSEYLVGSRKTSRNSKPWKQAVSFLLKSRMFTDYKNVTLTYVKCRVYSCNGNSYWLLFSSFHFYSFLGRVFSLVVGRCACSEFPHLQVTFGI